MTESSTAAINRAVMDSHEPVETTAEHLKHRVNDAIDNVRDRAGRMGEQLGSMSASARDAASDFATTTGRRANELMYRGRDRAYDLEGRLETTIQERPVGAVLIAAGVGFLVGCLLARR